MKIFFQILFILLLITSINTSCIINSCSDSRYKKLSYDGIIVDMYKDKNNRNMRTFKIRMNNKELIEIADWYPSSWEYANIGDSILKKNNELQIQIKKPNGQYHSFLYKY